VRRHTAAAKRIERVLWNDPASGVMRHADAGYPIAIDCARENGLNLPSCPETSQGVERGRSSTTPYPLPLSPFDGDPLAEHPHRHLRPAGTRVRARRGTHGRRTGSRGCGTSATLPAVRRPDRTIELAGRWLTPGLVDCHNHLVFAGQRAAEFARRTSGSSYAEIAREGAAY